MPDTPYVGGSSATPASVAPGGAPVRAAIARAAQATGMDFNYLLAQAKIESSLNPSAKAPTSSAAGLYQFTNGTWLQTLDRHGAEHGLGWAGDAISGGRITDPTMRAQIMALRYDPQASALMAGELAADNRAELATALGREPDAAELYLGHFLGIGGATTFLSALSANPNAIAASILPQAAGSNRSIFYGPEGARTVGGVMDLIRGRVANAMETGGAELWASATSYDVPNPATPGFTLPVGGPIAQEFHSAQAQMPAPTATPSRSMADTLNDSFGGSAAGAPAHIRDAYAKLARFGL
ncbi:lytic transglycosylase domain-containing protein [uncultured Novosphingobium sp.]|uniref:lytic transglycosylase domain-containing protein n=1 Tax=uncultured Novosphingobium sp. TaxID=292277 RepID=UPI00338D489E